MSDYLRKADFLACASEININFCWLKERVKELRRDMKRLEAENRELMDKVQRLEVDLAVLKGRFIGCQQGVKESWS